MECVIYVSSNDIIKNKCSRSDLLLNYNKKKGFA